MDEEEEKEDQVFECNTFDPPANMKLYLFYGMLNLEMLAHIVPFSEDECPATAGFEEKFEVLKSRSVSLTCPGWTRVFG